jgi:hypothetical protein
MRHHALRGAFRVSDPAVHYDVEVGNLRVERDSQHAVISGSGDIRVETVRHLLQTELAPKRMGIMLVGWGGGNNGTTLTACLAANPGGLAWETRSGPARASFLGSVSQAAAVRVASDANTGITLVCFSVDSCPLFARERSKSEDGTSTEPTWR